MTRHLIISLAIFLVSCGQESATIDNSKVDSQALNLADSSQSFSISRATEDDFLRAKNNYKDTFIQDTLTIQKFNGLIKLPLDEPNYPSSIIFKDELVEVEETEEKVYQYLGHFPNSYLVSGTFWEHYECYLIDKETGQKTTTWNKPFLSPASEYFANLSLDYGMEGVPNAIQIWRVDPKNRNNLSKYVELDQQIWVPSYVVWESDNSVILKVSDLEKYLNEEGQPNENDYYYLRLRLK